MIDKLKDNALLLLILSIGFCMRFYHFADWSLTNDELSALSRLQFNSLSDVIEHGVRLDDMHPMGVQVFLWYWTKLFGISPFAVRLPFVILGCLSLVLFYKIATHYLDRNRALLALSLFSCSSFPIMYSQLARPYSPGLFFSLLFVLAWSKLTTKNNGTSLFSKWNLVLIIGGVGAMYSHYFSFLFVGLVGLVGLFFISEKKKLLSYLLSGCMMFILYIPNLSVFITHFSVGGLGGDGGWLGPPGKYAILQFLFYALNNDWILVNFLVIAIVVSLSMMKLKSIEVKYTLVFLLLGIMPVLIAYFYSLIKNPVYQYSILLFGYPMILFAIASQINFNKLFFQKTFLILTIILTFTSTAFTKRFYSSEQFAVFKEIAIDMNNYAKKYGNENICYTVNVIKPFYINYYLKEVNFEQPIAQYCCNNNDYYLQLDSILKNTDKKYFLHAWSNNYHAPELEFRIRKYFPYLIEQDIHFNSGVYLFSKDSFNSTSSISTRFFEKNDFEKNYWNIDEKLFKQSKEAKSGNIVSIVDSSIEYGIAYTNSLEQLQLMKGRSLVIQIDAKIKKLPAFDKLMMVVEIDSPKGEIKVWRSLQFQPFIRKESEWTTMYYGYKYVEDINPEDILKVYIYNPGKYDAEFDDMVIRVVD